MKRLFLTGLLAIAVQSASLAQWTPTGAAATGNTNIYNTNSTGNVGIGTTNPQSKLTLSTVQGAGTFVSKNESLLINQPNTNNGEFVGINIRTNGVTYPNIARDRSVSIHFSGPDFANNAANTTYGKITVFHESENGGVVSGSLGLFTSNAGVLSEKMTITPSGRVGIGTTLSTASASDPYKLYVTGGIRTEQVKVDLASSNGWADYVFHSNYYLRPLSEVESYIQANQHLPEVPSAAEVAKEGINLGEMDATLLKKIEELTLYVIEQKKESDAMKKLLLAQNQKIQALEKQLLQSKK